MQTLIYSVIGSLIFVVAWAVPEYSIASTLPRILCQVVAVVVAAFFLPTPSDPQAAFASGQYAFAGGAVLVIIWYAIRKARKN